MLCIFSGAGKTTLLHTLLSRNLKNLEVKGDVLVNGYKLGKDIKYVSGFIHQVMFFYLYFLFLHCKL